MPDDRASEVLTDKFEAMIADFRIKNPRAPIPLRGFFFKTFRVQFFSLVFLEIFATSLSVANLIVAKELISIYLDQEEDAKHFDAAEIAKYTGIMAAGMIVWVICNQTMEFYSQYLAILLKKVNNGLMHKKMLKLSHRSLAM